MFCQFYFLQSASKLLLWHTWVVQSCASAFVISFLWERRVYFSTVDVWGSFIRRIQFFQELRDQLYVFFFLSNYSSLCVFHDFSWFHELSSNFFWLFWFHLSHVFVASIWVAFAFFNFFYLFISLFVCFLFDSVFGFANGSVSPFIQSNPFVFVWLSMHPAWVSFVFGIVNAFHLI